MRHQKQFSEKASSDSWEPRFLGRNMGRKGPSLRVMYNRLVVPVGRLSRQSLTCPIPLGIRDHQHVSSEQLFLRTAFGSVRFLRPPSTGCACRQNCVWGFHLEKFGRRGEAGEHGALPRATLPSMPDKSLRRSACHNQSKCDLIFVGSPSDSPVWLISGKAQDLSGTTSSARLHLADETSLCKRRRLGRIPHLPVSVRILHKVYC